MQSPIFLEWLLSNNLLVDFLYPIKLLHSFVEHLRNKHRVSTIRYKKYTPPPPIVGQTSDGRRMFILPKSSVMAGQNSQSGIKMLNLQNAKAVVIPKNARVVRTGEGGQMKLLVPTSPQKQGGG